MTLRLIQVQELRQLQLDQSLSTILEKRQEVILLIIKIQDLIRQSLQDRRHMIEETEAIARRVITGLQIQEAIISLQEVHQLDHLQEVRQLKDLLLVIFLKHQRHQPEEPLLQQEREETNDAFVKN